VVEHELAAFARVAEAPEGFKDELEAVDWVIDLLAALHFETVLVPARYGSLVTLTEPEARFQLPLLSERSVAVNPIPVDVLGLANRSAATARAVQPEFVFVGSFNHGPNRAAVLELVEQIVPRLNTLLPTARVRIAGANPPQELFDRTKSAGVEWLGWIDDLPALLRGATAFLAPIRSGAGMRVKLLEAMACGCPVVSTRLGVSGIPVRDSRDVLLAESIEEFVAAARTLAEDRELAARIGEAGRQLVERQHGLSVQGERRERIWAAALAAAGRR
jgi:glycosyltransferase involved in cell wall biosynthesis